MSITPRITLLCLAALALAAGCTVGEATFDPVEYDTGNLTISVVTGDPIVRAALQVTVSELNGLAQKEVFTEARYVDLGAGSNRFSYHVDLPDGTYRLYLHLHDGQQRRAAVIRELTVHNEADHA